MRDDEKTINEPIELWEEGDTPNLSKKLTQSELDAIEAERDRQGALNTGPLDTVLLIHSDHRPNDPPMTAELICEQIRKELKMPQIMYLKQYAALKKYVEDNCEFVLQVEQDDMELEGNCSAIDEETDKATEAWIQQELDAGNVWAWACVKVECRFRQWTGRAILGGCSYKSEEDFKVEGGYYADMKQESLQDCVRAIVSDMHAIEALNKEMEQGA